MLTVELLYNDHLGYRRKVVIVKMRPFAERAREVFNKSQCMDFLSAGTKKKWPFSATEDPLLLSERWPLVEDRLHFTFQCAFAHYLC